MEKLLLLFFFLGLLKVQAQRPEVVISMGHNDFISTIDMNSDASLIASGGVDKLIKIIDVTTGKELRTLSGNDGRVNFIKFDNTGKLIAAALNNGEIKIWEVKTGKVINSFPSNSSSFDFDFCFGNEKIVYLDESSKLCLINYLTKEEPQKFEITGLVRIKVHPDGKRLYGLDYKGFLKCYDLTTGNEIKSVRLFKEFNYPTCRMDIDFKAKYLAAAFDDNIIRIFDPESLKLFAQLKGNTSRIFDLKFDEKSQHLITTEHNNIIRVYDVPAKKEKLSTTITTFGPTAIEAHPKEKIFLINDGKIIHYVKQRTGKILKTFKAQGNKVINMAYDQQGEYLAAATGDITIKLWNLKQNKIDKVILGFFPVAFTPDGKRLASMGGTLTLTMWDVKTGNKLYDLNTESELIQNLSFSKDGKYLAGAGYYGIIKVWDLETKQLIKHFTGHAGGIYGTSFSPDGKYIASAGMDQTIRIWDFTSGKEIKQIKGHTIIVSDVKFSPDGKILASSSWDKTIKLWNTDTWELKNTLEGHINMITSINFNVDGSLLASSSGNNSVAAADNSARIWDVNTGQELCSFKNHQGIINKVIFDHKSELVFSSGDDGFIKIWNFKECEEIGSLISVNRSDYVILTPDNYYTASKDALEGVSFRIGADLYPFEQFDLRLNRPDIVAARIGKTHEGLINAYNYVYKKRLKKMGFKEEDLGQDFHLPKIRIVTENLPIITHNRKIKLEVRAEDDLYKLNRLNVFVNDVPIYGIEGIDLTSENIKSVLYELDIELIPGPNKIQISTLNEKGAESLRVTYNVIREDEEAIGNLYIVAIGVSKYKDERFALTYPVKDAIDIINTLKESGKLYSNVYLKELHDEQVTKENIIALSEFLKNTKVEDVVIFFIAGHGVLDSKFDYYYGTYDMDFDNPTLRGLPYEELDKLFNRIKALKKLLIMDTCHSGEVDKDEIEETKDAELEIKDVNFRAAGIGVRQKEGIGLENSYDLMQSLFSDIRKGSGATVISSAGGVEYAMESDKWKNGLFTYCLLEGLNTNAADINKDGEIILSELRNYVYEKVKELSGGKQKPTARSENLTLDYRIW